MRRSVRQTVLPRARSSWETANIIPKIWAAPALPSSPISIGSISGYTDRTYDSRSIEISVVGLVGKCSTGNRSPRKISSLITPNWVRSLPVATVATIAPSHGVAARLTSKDGDISRGGCDAKGVDMTVNSNLDK